MENKKPNDIWLDNLNDDVKGSFWTDSKAYNPKMYFSLKNLAIKNLSELIEDGVEYLTIPCDSTFIKYGIALDELRWSISFYDEDNTNGFLAFLLVPSVKDWKAKFSIDELFSALKKANKGLYEIAYLESDVPEILVSRDIQEFHVNLEDLQYIERQRLFDLVTQSVLGILSHESSDFGNHVFINTFNFPLEIKAACEQYLIYFSEFLADLGIGVNTSIETSEEGSIFKVVPKDPKKALSKIKEALDVYLAFPSIPDLEAQAANFTDLGVLQLLSNINHFKSQYQLAVATIQAKEATIQALQSTINSLNLNIFKQTKQIEPKKNEVDVLGGLITLKPIETKYGNLNVKKLLEMLKRK